MAKTAAKKITILRKHHAFDAQGQILGRLAGKIAIILRGKHKASYRPNVDAGDFVTVINASKIKISGKKIEQKSFYHHTKFPGGIKEIPLKKLLRERPDLVIRNAVLHMIPKNRLRNNIMKRLTIKI